MPSNPHSLSSRFPDAKATTGNSKSRAERNGDELAGSATSALFNEAAEKAILGNILLENAAYEEALQLGLKSSDFSLDSHQRIFERMADLAESGQRVDTITLADALVARNELEVVGDVPYIASLLEGLPERPSIASYVQLVRTAAARRKAAEHLERAQYAAVDPSISVSALVEMANALGEIPAGTVQAPRFSEDDLAGRFSKRYACDLRYVHGWRKWLRWDDTRWNEDRTLHVSDLVRGVCREVSAGCEGPKQAIKLASKATTSAVERFAAADRRHAATVGQWDRDPWLLNTPTGTMDLRSGELRAHRATDYLTKITAVGPGGDCVLWRQFLHRVTGGDSELEGFLQRMAGYCLTGLTTEHALFFVYGTGGNGKGVFLRALSAILGDYAKTAPVTSFTTSGTGQHPTDLAGLRGARLVTAIETDEGSHWAEAKIKALTGGALVGYADTPMPDPFPNFCFGDCYVEHAFQWQNGVRTDLGALAAGVSSAADGGINNKGLIAGHAENGEVDPLIPGFPEIRAVLWENGVIRDLGTLSGGYGLLAIVWEHEGGFVMKPMTLPVVPLGSRHRCDTRSVRIKWSL